MRAAHSGWRRWVFSVIVLAWANVTLQPCVMAMSMAEHQVQSEASENRHHGQHDRAGHEAEAVRAHCNHCPPDIAQQIVGCDTAVSAGCEGPADANNDWRNGKSKTKDTTESVATINVPADRSFLTPLALEPSLRIDRPVHLSDPPLSVRLCVFLK